MCSYISYMVYPHKNCQRTKKLNIELKQPFVRNILNSVFYIDYSIFKNNKL